MGEPTKKPLIFAFIFSLFLLLLTVLALIFLQSGKKSPTPFSAPPPPSKFTEPRQEREGIYVETIDSKYKTTSGPTAGWFKTGQEADIMLSGVDFNNTGGPLLFNHPGGIATDGKRLLLADRNNNRILIWNSLPTKNTPPDLVLGQENFTTNNPGTGRNQLNWPVSVATHGQRVLVTDTENDRILIWNRFPTQNRQAADLVLEGDVGEGSHDRRGVITWPWAVWTNGEKMVITSTAGRQVHIWNTFPTQNNQRPDIILQLQDFGTPRSIGSNGNNLVIGDHNAFGDKQGTFFWKTFPGKNDQPYDFFMANPKSSGKKLEISPPPGDGPPLAQGEVLWGPTFTRDGKFIAFGVQLYIWNSFPENEKDAPDLIVGRTGPDGKEYWFIGGDGSGLAATDDKLYVSLNNGNKIVGFKRLPTSPSQHPNFAVGSPDINTNTLKTNFFFTNPVPATDGKSLFVSSDFDGKLYVFKQLPDESGAKPDFVYHNLPSPPWDNALFANTLVMAGQQGVIIWNKLPLAGELPDATFNNSIGNVRFQDIKGVALDEKYFYLSDHGANKVYVWEGIPKQNSNPKFTLNVDQPWRLSSDGNYLAVTAIYNHTIQIYKVTDLSVNSQPVGSIGRPGLLNLPESALVSQGHLFVSDTGFNRVFVWDNIEEALNGKDAEVLLGAKNLEETEPELGKDKVFWPTGLAFDGNYLWVGEFKFSGRILRFSPSE